MGDDYIATIIMDRFLTDKCHWINGGPNITYFHDNHRLSIDGLNDDILHGKKVQDVTCLTNPFVEVGTCGLRDEESFYKSEDRNAFNATVEFMK